MIYLKIAYNLGIVVTFFQMSSFLYRNYTNRLKYEVFQGILMSIALAACMLNSVDFFGGVHFDGRSIIISLTALFYGPLPALITTVFAMIIRTLEGGSGLYAGFAIILSAASIGIITRVLLKKTNRVIDSTLLFSVGVIVHISLIASLFLFPENIAYDVIGHVAVPMLLIYPITTVGLGKIIQYSEVFYNNIKLLKESEENYRLITEYSSDVIWVFNVHLRQLTYVSPSCQNLTEYNADELLHMNMQALFTTTNFEYIKSLIHSQVAPVELNMTNQEIPGPRLYLEFQIKQKQGTIIWIEISYNIKTDTDTFLLIGNARDITERKLASIKNARLMEIVVNTDEGLASICSDSLEFEYVNPSFAHMHGVTEESLVGESIFKVYDARERELHKKRIYESIDQDHIVYEIDHINSNGDVFPTKESLAFIKDGTGKTGHIALNMFDLTEERLLTEKYRNAKVSAENANESKRRFLANMSHEVRTPLNGIMGMTQALMMTDLSNLQKELLTLQSKSSKTLLQVIDSILEYSRNENESTAIENRLFCISELMGEIEHQHQKDLENKSLCFDMQIAAEVPKVINADSQKIKQVLTNLIDNAIKYTNVGGVQVFVSFASINQNSGTLKFTVKDSGIGMTPLVMDQIFQSFGHFNNSKEKIYGGIGLGLAISRQVAKKLGGELEVISSLGQGSEFSFTCKVQIETEGAIDLSKQIVKSKQVKAKDNIKILLAEDDFINRSVVKHFASKQGWQVIEAEDGKKAVSRYLLEDVDIVIMDLQMPVMNGLEAAKEIQLTEKFKSLNTPMIAMTAFSSESDRNICIESGLLDFVTKPFSVEDFYFVIKKWS